jgi:hypothetical protein
LENLQKRARKLPGAPQYFKPLEWPEKNMSLRFSKGAKRMTFTDEVIKIKKPIPSSAHYYPEKPKGKLLLGKSDKAEGVNYLSDVEHLGVSSPGPSSYKPKVSFNKPPSHHPLY